MRSKGESNESNKMMIHTSRVRSESGRAVARRALRHNPDVTGEPRAQIKRGVWDKAVVGKAREENPRLIHTRAQIEERGLAGNRSALPNMGHSPWSIHKTKGRAAARLSSCATPTHRACCTLRGTRYAHTCCAHLYSCIQTSSQK